MPVITPKTNTATDSPDGSLSDDATAVLLSESPGPGEIWYFEGFWAVSDGAGSDASTTVQYVVGKGIYPAEASDAEIGSTDPTGSDLAVRSGGTIDLSKALSDANEGAWFSIGDLIHPNEKAVLNVTSDSEAESSTVTYRSIARQVV